jgi:GT2 family glycosyltransferase
VNEVIVVVDGYNKGITGYLNDFSRGRKNLKWLVLDEKVEKSRARNMGIKHSLADVIYFLDDDSFIDDDNIRLLEEKFNMYSDVSVIGGPNLTPENSSYFQRVSGYIFTSFFTAWKMKKRYYNVSGKDEYCNDKSLILCNLALRRSAIDRENVYFNERLNYNEENMLLEELEARGHKMLCSAELKVYHERRQGLLSFSRQIFGSGRGRAIMTLIRPATLLPVHVLPALFIVYLAVLVFYSHPVIYAPLFLYLGMNVVNAAYVSFSRKEGIGVFVTVFFLSVLAHLSYGTGFIIGLIWRTKA